MKVSIRILAIAGTALLGAAIMWVLWPEHFRKPTDMEAGLLEVGCPIFQMRVGRGDAMDPSMQHLVKRACEVYTEHGLVRTDFWGIYEAIGRLQKEEDDSNAAELKAYHEEQLAKHRAWQQQEAERARQAEIEQRKREERERIKAEEAAERAANEVRLAQERAAHEAALAQEHAKQARELANLKVAQREQCIDPLIKERDHIIGLKEEWCRKYDQRIIDEEAHQRSVAGLVRTCAKYTAPNTSREVAFLGDAQFDSMVMRECGPPISIP